MREIWKVIEGYNGKYEVSSYGRVKSFYRNNWIFLKPNPDREGYLSVDLVNNTQRKTFKIHRLVCAYFHPNPELKREVNHINMDKSNNHYFNLEWCTSKENKEHAKKFKLLPKKSTIVP